MGESALSLPLTLLGLERAIRDTDSPVLLVPPRILRRVIRQHQSLRGLRLDVPHAASYVVSREDLLKIVNEFELGIERGADLPDRIILLPEPDGETLRSTAAQALLTRYRRLLFHGRVHLELEERLARGEGGEATLPAWLHRIGGTEFDEIRTVLLQEGFLFPSADQRSVFIEFAAVYLELGYFAPASLALWFPALDRSPNVEAVLAEAVEADRLLEATGLPGAVPPSDDRLPSRSEAIAGPPASPPLPPRPRSPSLKTYQRLARRADWAASQGNLVRSCVLWMRAASRARGKAVSRAHAEVLANLGHLVQRLQSALGFPDAEVESWLVTLSTLAAWSDEGLRSREARLLWDLQRICVDHERSLFALDLWGWASSLGNRPIWRPLARLEEVLLCRRLASALRRLPAARMPDAARQTLHGLLHQAEQRSESRLRRRFRPIIDGALRRAQLLPSTPLEEVASRKVVEELIDRILHQGFLMMGDLRDALARNNLKAHDLAGPKDLLLGDQLLRADREMGASLEGVYRRGEFYLRAMQVLSSLAFGTRTGRLLMRCLVFPFGGAYLAEAGTQHLIALATGSEAHHGQLLTVLLLGVFLLLLINSERFREGAWHWMRWLGSGVRYLISELPGQLMRWDLVQRIVRSRLCRWTYHLLVKPLAFTALICWVLPRVLSGWENSALRGFGVFLGANLLINSWIGRDLEELAAEWLARAWQWLGVHILARLFWLIMDLFRALIEAMERVLYSVDEWRRFRVGERGAMLAAKAILGTIWLLIAYVARLCVTVLIEPQVNPIKHFPVVTVSHKILLPFIPALAGVFALAMDKGAALTLAGAVIAAIPGVFGFLAWELRENWRLYVANRPSSLRPVVVGQHGETMRRLLMPGLHSGAIPKRHARLRKADEQARRTGNQAGIGKQRRALREIETGVFHFVERELLWLLGQARCWNLEAVCLGSVQLATNRVKLALECRQCPGETALITFEARGPWLVGGLTDLGLLARFSSEQRDVLAAGLVNLYKLAGVDLLRQEIEAQLPHPTPPYDVARQGLVVWPTPSRPQEVRYDFGAGEQIPPRSAGTMPPGVMPSLNRSRLLFGRIRVDWSRWVELWEELASSGEARPQAGSSLQRLWGPGPRPEILPRQVEMPTHAARPAEVTDPPES